MIIAAKMLEELPSCIIANAFYLAKVIAENIVEFKGLIFSWQKQRKGLHLN